MKKLRKGIRVSAWSKGRVRVTQCAVGTKLETAPVSPAILAAHTRIFSSLHQADVGRSSTLPLTADTFSPGLLLLSMSCSCEMPAFPFF